MNDPQRLFWEQARSDHEAFQALEKQPACHRLHYLQMCTEKLGKAYFWRSGSPPKKSHGAFVQFLREVANRREVRETLGYDQKSPFESFINSVMPLAAALQNLTPDLAGEGPNPEYPWPHDNPKTAPALYIFPLWQDLQNTARGRQFRRLIELLLQSFPRWA